MSFLVFLGLNMLAAVSGGFFSPGQWYEELNKPSWQPPKWAFPVVWTVLYVLNAVAGWLVWTKTGLEGAGVLAMAIYVGSLILNAAWSWLFFGRRQMKLALGEAILLWLSVALQIYVFFPIDQIAALILLPYLCWVSVAVLLNRTLIKLNPQFV